jgi:hypothetical protein
VGPRNIRGPTISSQPRSSRVRGWLAHTRSSPKETNAVGAHAARLAAWRAFRRAHADVTGVLEAELQAEHDLSLTWYDVLVQLEKAPNHRRRMVDLAFAMLGSNSGLTRVIDRMDRNRPCPAPGDGAFPFETVAEALTRIISRQAGET